MSFMWRSEQVSPMEIDNIVNDDISVVDAFEDQESFEQMVQVLGVVAVVGQASRHFDPLIANIIELTKSILDVYENVQFNKKICDCLIDRIESVEMAIKSLKRHKNDKNENDRYFFKQTTYNAFHQLIVVLEKMQQYITDVSQLHGLRKFIDIMDIKKQFEKLIREFDMIVNTLQLKMSFSEKEQSIRDKVAIEDDINTTTKFLNNVKSGITESTRDTEQNDTTSLKPQISDIFEEIIIKKNYVTETNKTTKFKAKIIPSDKITNPDGPSRGNVHKMSYEDKCVACKYFDNDQNARFHNELSMLYNLNHSENILRFYGLSELDEGQSQVLVFDWADRGDLQTLYENYDLDWPVRLQIAVGICRGLLFLHGCQILHRELRCQNVVITEDFQPKLVNFNFGRPAKYSRYFVENITAVVHWLAPEKLRLGNKVKFSHKCDIFSFGMLLWEIAFEKIPYKDWSYTSIIDHVKAGKRESMDIGPNPIQREFTKIIRAAWQDDPTLRPGLHELFIQLDKLHKDNPVEPSQPVKKNHIELETTDAQSEIIVVEENNVQDKDLELKFLGIVNSILLLEEGIKSHKSGEKKVAWECFQAHADLGNNYAKYWQAHYLTEGYHVEKDTKKGTKYFKEAADADVADSQLRYAFSLYHDQIIQDTDAFLHYLTLAAENGNATAQFNLGRMYYAGMVGLNKDKEKGLQYLKMAALKNQPRAIQFLTSVKIDRYV
ncbi:kinase-like domain-containing protein [Gigaspora rosea]|uniref:Kinase-like domain-containing protein n=1 Tax=Gigaspora rosea TaxID=44941 RepID=A0A397V682_9GLOM|nr:kinase-like domain-containing protein [Gigaspora rosea]